MLYLFGLLMKNIPFIDFKCHKKHFTLADLWYGCLLSVWIVSCKCGHNKKVIHPIQTTALE